MAAADSWNYQFSASTIRIAQVDKFVIASPGLNLNEMSRKTNEVRPYGKLRTPIASVLSLFVLTGLVLLPPWVDNRCYLDAINAKHALLEASHAPRIVIVGGSNVCYGIDCEKLQHRLNKNVVNMGLHMGLGLRYMLSEVISSIGAGDTVVVSPEYEHFYGLLDGQMTLAEIFFVFPKAIRYMTFSQIIGLPSDCAALLKTKPTYYTLYVRNWYRKIKHQPLLFDEESRPTFNTWGDEIGHLDKPSVKFEQSILSANNEPQVDNEALFVLTKFQENLRAKNARMVVCLPYISEAQYRFKQAQIDAVFLALRSNNIEVLSHPRNSVFPEQAFYDSPYHLNREYRSLRTTNIEQLLM